MEDLAVEVRGENSAYYKAYITNIHDYEVTVVFENDWQPESKFPYHRVRLPPAVPKNEKPISVTEGQEVEVFSRFSEYEVCGWWPVLVKMTKGDFHVVEYLGWEPTFTEIVPSDRLRLKNTNQSITKDTFHQFEIPIPEDVQEYSKVESAHKEFKKAIGAAICKYNSETKCLQITFFSSQGSHDGLKKRVCMLSDIHFRSLREKVLLLNSAEEAARQLGTQEAVKKVRSMLGYAEESVQVPQMLVVCNSKTQAKQPAQANSSVRLSTLRPTISLAPTQSTTTAGVASLTSAAPSTPMSAAKGLRQVQATQIKACNNNPSSKLPTTSGALPDILRQVQGIFPDHLVLEAIKKIGSRTFTLQEICEEILELQTQENRNRPAISDVQKREVNQVGSEIMESKVNDGLSSNDVLTCTVCMDRQRNAVFQPCGHLVSCWNCSNLLSNCPVCRRFVTHKIRTYVI